ncbi:plasmid recombination protein [Thomasclavelia cocleata]|uniref:Plasmid recombination enzyme n=1 Tax=Thomasclavelia cocleata TaxID=69824 RepID=A0A1I0HTS7_9FIRM|nr:plasmid recombination protein [Thomasclavelia cocleata]MCR1961945.1 plasmid recombination protein [Thomasclavelia cocleata]SET87622.1 Plasmid recombination enzyme [Thomasclavelia cocleata]
MSEHITRTISAMLEKGNENHNSLKFIAHNVDPSRTNQNIEYKNMKIQSAYHLLFDDALKRYNTKQTRHDRVIKNYYEKIRTSKQEKPFHEVIIQIGNKDDTNATSPEGELAKTILDEYMQSFQERNSSLFVFSAHLHMDEETPHLHIDFIPYTTNSKRGLDTRVSLKQALSKLGFKGGSRSDTEWNQWIVSEKQVLAKIMEKYNIKWLKLGTHEKHLRVLNYEKKMRQEEINTLSSTISQLSQQKETLTDNIEQVKNEISEIEEKLYI